MLFSSFSSSKGPTATQTGLYYSFILGFVLNMFPFNQGQIGTSNAGNICSRFIQDCSPFIFLQGLPDSWDNGILHFFIFLMLSGSIYCFIKKTFVLSAVLLIFPLIAEALWGFVLYEQSSIPFIYYHFFPCFVFIFSKDAISDLKWMIVLLYVLSGWVKLDEGWLAGGYFNSLSLGLPLFPKVLTAPLSILVTLFELLSVLLLTRKKTLRNVFLIFFVIFHVYSFIMVGYKYPLLCLPLLYFTFLDSTPIQKPGKALICTALYLILSNLLPHMLDPDYKLTDRGNSLAMNMFDGSRQSFSTIKIFYKDGTVLEKVETSMNSYDRVKPYHLWLRIKSGCSSEVERISWHLEVAINGLPYQKVVDLDNVCQSKYKPLAENEWIKLGPSERGRPTYNGFMLLRSSKEEVPFSSYVSFVHNHKQVFRWMGIIISLILLLFFAIRACKKTPA